MQYLAIDPGASAGLALITGPKSVIAISAKQDLQSAFDLLEAVSKSKAPTIIGVEKVHAIFQASAASTFTFGSNYGFWLGVLKFLGLQHTDVTPKMWQDEVMNLPKRPDKTGLTPAELRKAKQLHKDSIKMESFRAAQVAFPNTSLPCHDVADAVNIARYLRLTYENGLKGLKECV